MVQRRESDRSGHLCGSQNQPTYDTLEKAILAYLPESRVDEIIELHGLEEETPQSIGTREEPFGALDAIRNR